MLQDRLAGARADREAGLVHVVRGGKRLARARHHLDEAGLTESGWRGRWEAERWFCQADGESGKRYGNETIRISPDGEVSIKLPAPLAYLANAPHGRYVLACRVVFAHRGTRVGGPRRSEPGDRLPHPPGYGPGPLVCDRVLADPVHRPSRWRPRSPTA